MSSELVAWMTKHPSLAVALAVGLVALVIAVLGLVVATWLKPKLTELDALRIAVSELKTSASRGASAADAVSGLSTDIAVIRAGLDDIKAKNLPEEIGSLTGRLVTLEVAKTSEQDLLQTKLQLLEKTVGAALSAIDDLQNRSEEEIERIQAETEQKINTIRRDGREELVRQSTAERIRLALEQAEQDLQLALIRELLTRIDDSRHPDAVAKVHAAQSRVEALRIQAQAGGNPEAGGSTGA